MTSKLLVAIDKRISHLQEARALLTDFVKIEQISKHRGRGNYFGISEKRPNTRAFTPPINGKVGAGPAAARTVRRTSPPKAAKTASKKLASLRIARTIKFVSKKKSGKKKLR
jgi:hypothetical protein